MREIPVLVLTWNNWELTTECLTALRLTEAELIWVIDNGSDEDRSTEIERDCNVRVIRLEQNFGWAGGYNRALRVASAEGYFAAYLLNNDTRPRPGFLNAASAILAGNPEIAVVGSTILYSTADEQWVKFDGTYHNPCEERFGGSTGMEAANSSEANGAGMLIHLAAYARIGGFDERFFCYHEEAQWCARAIAAGWRISVTKTSVIVHQGEGSDRSANSRYYRLRNKFLLGQVENDRIEFGCKLRIAREIASEAIAHDGQANTAGYEAALQALRDGWTGRWGRRPTERAGRFWRFAVAIKRIIAITRRKLESRLRAIEPSSSLAL